MYPSKGFGVLKMNSLKSTLLSLIFMSVCSLSVLKGETRIMPLGDSITWDAYHTDNRSNSERSSYRNYLWYKLKDIEYSANFVGSQSGGGKVEPYFDGDNEGHHGWSSYEIAESVYHFLAMNPPDVILLHIGTNDWDSSPDGVEHILDEIDRFENDNDMHIGVILARIINRNPKMSLLSDFNRNIDAMAHNRIHNGDDIKIVNMENGAGIDYRADIADGTHPNDCGYEKMANVWFSALTGKGSPGLKYANCDGKYPEEKIRDALNAYPETLVPKENIINIEVDVEKKTVVFTVSIPESGITF